MTFDHISEPHKQSMNFDTQDNRENIDDNPEDIRETLMNFQTNMQ